MPLDLNAEYNNRAMVPEHASIMGQWAADAAAYRGSAKGVKLNVAYGDTARAKYDFFPASSPKPGAPVMMFIHGGYWQALDKSSFSHMAHAPNSHGFDVAIAGYDLCPNVPLGVIVDQMIACAKALKAKTGRMVLPFGHSAGGHLAACLGGTNWPAFGEDEPIIAGAMPISGLFHLSPLMQTFVNNALKLDAPQCSRLSPLTWTPRRGLKVTAVVGGDESSEYHRQTRALVTAWSAVGAEMDEIIMPNANHFTVLAPLMDPSSSLTKALIALA
jgi:arylformamidase